VTFTFYRLLLPLLLALASAHCWSQQNQTANVPGYEVKHFTDENGLPQNSVKSIARDTRGNIWLATERGLVRYDGKDFVKFDGLGNSYSDRNVYGFLLYPGAGRRNFVAVTEAKKCFVIQDGKAVLDTTMTWDMFLQPEKDPRMPEVAFTEFDEQMYFNQISLRVSLYLFPDARYFVYNKKKVGYYVNNKLKKVFPFPDKSIFNFFRIGNDLYHLDASYGLSRFQAAGTNSITRPEILSGDILASPFYASKATFKVYWNNACGQAFISINKSLFLLERSQAGGLTSKLVLEGFDCQAKQVNSIYFDANAGRVFVGTGQDGVYVFEKKTFRTVVSNGLAANEVYYGQSIFDKTSLLTTKGVKFNFDSITKQVTATSLTAIAKATDWDHYSILKDRQGNIWTKMSPRLFRFDSTGNRLLSEWSIESGVTQIYEGTNGRIWIGSRTNGLFYIDPREPKATLRFFGGNKLINISWMQHDADENLWIGTGTGLFKIHLPTKKISQIKGLEDIYIRSLYIPAGSNQIWITTYANGIFLLDSDRLTRFPLDKQQYLASGHCIVEDRKGFFWVTTNRGLFQIKKSDLLAYAKKPFEIYYHYYAKDAGFNTNEFNGGCQPCAVIADNGLVSLPSINGLVWFTPEQIRPEQPNGQIYIDQLAINEKKSPVDKKDFSVPAGATGAFLKITAPYFGDPYNLRMSYRLLRDATPISPWKELDENRSISVPFPGAGKYTISVRKLNGFGPGNYGYRHVDILVGKYWYETWWFRLLMAIGVIVIFYFISKQRIKAIKKQNQLLEAKVLERTHDLEQAMRVLSTSEKQLEQQHRLHIHLIASISHDIRTPMRHMTYALDHSYALIENDQKDMAKTFMIQLKQGAERVYTMVDNIVNFIRPEVHNYESGLSQISLKEVVDEKTSLFKQIGDNDNAMILSEICPDITIMTDVRLLAIIIHNLIDNALKIRKGNRVQIYTDRTGGRLHLIIEDDGPGMPPELTEWLNAGSADDNQGLPARYEGIGLMMVKQIATILDLELLVLNEPGACIHVIFNRST
jgi:ligand-binding sensor domain-containing protein/signal transduction histidine kinase